MTKTKKNKKLFVIISVIVAVVILAAIFSPKKTNQTALPPLEDKKEISKNRIEISGYIEAAESQTLQAPGEGIIEKVYVAPGDRVKKGAPLFELDCTVQEYNLAQQEFAIQQERINGPSKKLKLMEQQKDLLKKQIDDRKIHAKFDGSLAVFKIQEGQYAKAQDSFGTLINREYLKATVEVAESDASRLKIGERAELKFPAVPDAKVNAIVTAFPAAARITSRGAAVLDAEIRINNPPENILPGYSFSGFIVAGEDEEILTVSQNAIRYKEGKPFVDIIRDKKTEEAEVTVEPYVHGFVKITSGVAEGDKLKDHQGED